jgi:PPM family protein phosphatase
VITSPRTHLPVVARTHPGMGGKINEDRYAISAHQLGNDDPRRSLLAVVADGIGGHRAGEVAAEIAVEEISSFIAASDGSRPVEILTAAIIQASQKIQQQSTLHNDQNGMGSTCVCVWIIEDRLYTASVGDSRLYLLRDKRIHQLTVDHTWIQEAMDLGLLTSDEAVDHPNQHVIRRYLGSPKTVEPDLRLRLDPEQSEHESRSNQGLVLQPGDQLLLCTDGLSDLVVEQEIAEILQANFLETSLDMLVRKANERGGHDNITLIGINFKQLDQPAPAAPERRSWVSWLFTLVGLTLICLLGIALAILLYRLTSSLFGFP